MHACICTSAQAVIGSDRQRMHVYGKVMVVESDPGEYSIMKLTTTLNLYRSSFADTAELVRL